jgi:hypothetical protein
MPTLDLNATSPDGKASIGVVPYVRPNGDPAVLVIIKKSAEGVFESTLDGQPAFALLLVEDSAGNGPWEFGHLLAERWEDAQKLAGKK